MAILHARTSWTKPRAPNETRRSIDLTPEEQANVRTALRFLVKRHGTSHKLAEAMGAKRATLMAAMAKQGAVSAGIAIRVARVATVPVEDVLRGAWPAVGACPLCGRT